VRIISACSTVFSGRDTQLNALGAGLGLSWAPEPFPVNATLPNSALRFELEGDEIQVDYLFLANISDTSGAMVSVPATFGSTGSNRISMTGFSLLVSRASDAACSNVGPAPFAEIARAVVVV